MLQVSSDAKMFYVPLKQAFYPMGILVLLARILESGITRSFVIFALITR